MKKVLVLVAILFLVGCGSDSGSTSKSKAGPVLNVSVMKDGEILVDGETMDMADVKSQITLTKARKGKILFYREGNMENATPEAMQLLQYMGANGIPFSLTTTEPEE
jgi:biopolymer transport protein ExbD